MDPRNNRRYKTIAKAVIERDGQCITCGTTEDLTADHIIPVSMGDEESWYDPDNMQAMCRRHNSQKSNRVGPVEETDWINTKWINYKKEKAA